MRDAVPSRDRRLLPRSNRERWILGGWQFVQSDKFPLRHFRHDADLMHVTCKVCGGSYRRGSSEGFPAFARRIRLHLVQEQPGGRVVGCRGYNAF